ncbi:hypothetical protein N431DRAFT_542807 [Stipitochalara longipes BDJ]|nr:hypothetical protein N431DRAFT_542807 [Stipitochalara longipes BDJ]
MAPIGVWNQSNLHENAIVRSVSALPFLALFLWAFIPLNSLSSTPYLESIVLSGRIRFGTLSTPILTKFLDIKFIDDFWRPRTIAYAPSTLGADPISWLQNLSFLVDYSLMYCIWLLESARKSNEYSPVRFPVIFGLAAQIFGVGIAAPLYFFVHFVNAPISRSATPGMRTIDPHFSRAIFTTLGLFSYLPVFLMFLGPSPSIRHRWTWAWQMFPLWVAVAQWIRTRTSASTPRDESSSIHQDDNESSVIGATISAFAAISAGVWMYMLFSSPYSLRTIFLPQSTSASGIIPLMRAHFQSSHLSAFGSALMWMVYISAELKDAALVQQSWVFLLSMVGLSTLCFGPGATLATCWYWREQILKREGKGETVERVGEEDGKGRYKKFARQSLDEICFGGTKGRFKVL